MHELGMRGEEDGPRRVEEGGKFWLTAEPIQFLM
jgi:hypothetical protein